MSDNHLADNRLRIGFIPLCDATALIVAVDKGFTAAEGLDVDLVRGSRVLLRLAPVRVLVSAADTRVLDAHDNSPGLGRRIGKGLDPDPPRPAHDGRPNPRAVARALSHALASGPAGPTPLT